MTALTQTNKWINNNYKKHELGANIPKKLNIYKTSKVRKEKQQNGHKTEKKYFPPLTNNYIREDPGFITDYYYVLLWC